MNKCKHETALFYRWLRGTWTAFATAPRAVGFDCGRMNCVTCGAWLSLAAANDDDPRVAVEIRAAERFASYLDHNYRPGVDRFDYCPTTKSDELCALCESLYLAAAICNHDENRETE